MGVTYFWWAMFCIALFTQGALWWQVRFIDEPLWLNRVAQLSFELEHNELNPTNSVYSGHPGMAAVMIGSLAHQKGVTLKGGLAIGVVLLNALSIATAISLSKLLRPKSMWWMVLAATLLFNTVYLRSSPTNAVMAPLSVLLVLIALWLYENYTHKQTQQMTVLLGAWAGVGLATRWPTTIIVFVPLLALLFQRLGVKKILLASASSLVVMIGIDPLMWYEPGDRLRYMIGHLFNSAFLANKATVGLMDFVFLAPLSIMGLLMALLLVVLGNRLRSPVSFYFLFILLVITGFFFLVFLNLDYQSVRYFHPMILLWEGLLSLFLLCFFQKQKTAKAVFVLLLTGGQIFSLIYAVLLPG
jgi:hypothetical protein